LTEFRRRKWNWIGHTLRRSDDSIAKQVLHWTPLGHREKGRPRNTWKRDLGRVVLASRCQAYRGFDQPL